MAVSLNYQDKTIGTLQRIVPHIQQAFVAFLKADGASPKTQAGYQGDVGHFLAWLVGQPTPSSLVEKTSEPEELDGELSLLGPITPATIDDYKQALMQTNTPTSTINRRLSTLRIFFRCAISHGWIATNPAHFVANTKTPKPATAGLSHQKKTKLLHPFARHLTGLGLHPDHVTQHVDHVTDFLLWLEKNSESSQQAGGEAEGSRRPAAMVFRDTSKTEKSPLRGPTGGTAEPRPADEG